MAAYLPQMLLLLAGCPRTFALVAVAPGFSAAAVPPLVRVTLAAGLALALAPMVSVGRLDLLTLTPQAYLALLLSEMLLGGIMGYLLSCLLEAARLAGEIVDLQIGFRAGALYDPLSGGTSSVVGHLWSLAALVFFFVIDGHHCLLGALMRSYALCPVGALVFHKELTMVALQAVQALFVLALQMSAPVVATLILADLALGLVGRAMPQMNLMMVGMPAKILVGLGALAACSPLLVNNFTRVLDLLQQYLGAALRGVGA
ncbi:MAG: flagellar biosynthetic protein FliR [Armatimonadota bacterium]